MKREAGLRLFFRKNIAYFQTTSCGEASKQRRAVKPAFAISRFRKQSIPDSEPKARTCRTYFNQTTCDDAFFNG